MTDLQSTLFATIGKNDIQLAAGHPLEVWHCADGRILLHWPRKGQDQVWLELGAEEQQWLKDELAQTGDKETQQ